MFDIHHSDSIFDCHHDFKPAIVREIINAGGDVETIFTPIPVKLNNKKKYLPGQRLLKSLNKEFLKQKQKKESRQGIVVTRIEKSLQNLLKEF